MSRWPQVPLLALFGSLQPEDYVNRSGEAIAAAKLRAMHNLQRCVVANTDDMAASADMIACVPH
jgi:peptidyl-tRNA hydrolase